MRTTAGKRRLVTSTTRCGVADGNGSCGLCAPAATAGAVLVGAATLPADGATESVVGCVVLFFFAFGSLANVGRAVTAVRHAMHMPPASHRQAGDAVVGRRLRWLLMMLRVSVCG